MIDYSQKEWTRVNGDRSFHTVRFGSYFSSALLFYFVFFLLGFVNVYLLKNNRFVERNRDGIKVGTRSSITDSRVLYFCGEHFRHELFPEPKWQTFVESS